MYIVGTVPESLRYCRVRHNVKMKMQESVINGATQREALRSSSVFFERLSPTDWYSRNIELSPANMQPWSSEQEDEVVRWIETLPTRMGGSGTPVLMC